MAQIFKPGANRWPIYIVAILGVGLLSVVGFFWFFGSPEYTDVGYRPAQPIEYSHKLHAGDLAIDCRYCHSAVEVSAKANVPSTEVCMNCHTMIGTDNPKLEPVRASWLNKDPIEWVRVHDLADYSYFNHAVHINVGVGCESCHGNVAAMEKVIQTSSLSMGWCLECHRAPEKHLRPIEEITTMGWVAPDNQIEINLKLIEEKNIVPPQDCSGCHR